MQRYAILIAAALVAVPMTTAAQTPETGPITNGDFETGTVPEAIAQAVAGAPGSEACVGIGHQIFWGDDTPQHVLLGDSRDPQPQDDGPQRLAEAYANGERDPVEDAEEQSGVNHCGQAGQDALWLTPQGRTRGAVGWTTPLGEDSATTFEFNADGDPFDREAVIHPIGSKSDHNLWQVQDQQKLYTENFEVLRFVVENEAPIPEPAHIEVGFSLSPGYGQHPFVGAFWEGAVAFDADDMQADGDGSIDLHPVEDGRITCPSNYPPCTAFKADYEAAGSDEDQRDLLGQTRIVQVSFWGFNKGEVPVVIDDVEIEGASTQAEELAEGNLNLNPLPEQLGS